MAPLPEKLEEDFPASDFRTRYTEVAKAHNAVLAENERLKQRLRWFQRQMFGTRSEKLLPLTPEQQALLAILEEAEKQSPIAATPVPAPTEKVSRRTLAPKAALHGWGEIPGHLERVDVPEVLSEEQKVLLAEGRIVKIRDEISERLAVRPQTLYVKRFLRGVYAKVDVDGCRTVLPLAPIESPFERGRADSSLLSFLIASKFCDHLPLLRIHKILLRQGVHLSPSTMSTWLLDLHALLLPIYFAMCRAVREGPLIHADETPCPVQLDRVAHKTHRGYLWVYGGGGHLVYEYTSTRGGEHPMRFLKGSLRAPGSARDPGSGIGSAFRGTLQTDGYAGYNAACQGLGLTRAGCHAHARRKFKDAEPHYPKVREYLELYASLFHLEAEWTRQGLSAPERLARRQVESTPLWAAMQAWIAAQTGTVLPKDVLGEAIGYTVGQKAPLEIFLADGAVPLSNNISERALRPVVLGRKNYLFFGSEEGARRGAVFYSLVQSCVALQLDPREYLEHVMARVSDVPESRILELTPAGWLAAKSRPQA
ncbi:MAG TPA: IS66 family transposase [Fibrobacteria bacterium]|nr:IS66 family transposase [Fibrobacteria bacterium]